MKVGESQVAKNSDLVQLLKSECHHTELDVCSPAISLLRLLIQSFHPHRHIQPILHRELHHHLTEFLTEFLTHSQKPVLASNQPCHPGPSLRIKTIGTRCTRVTRIPRDAVQRVVNSLVVAATYDHQLEDLSCQGKQRGKAAFFCRSVDRVINKQSCPQNCFTNFESKGIK